MLQKIVTVALVLAGLILAGLGVASGTVWRPSDTVTLSSGAHDSATLLRTEPGVLGLLDEPVTIRATAPADTGVVLAIGRASDVEGWIGTDASVVVTGASDWETLTVVEQEATTPETAAPVDPAVPVDPAAPVDPAVPTEPVEETPVVPSPDPAGSDMWIVETTGQGEATLEWTEHSSDQVLLAATVGETTEAPVVTLTWPREVSTPWVVPGVALGALLVLVGLVLGYFWFVAGPGRDRGRAGRPAGPRSSAAAAVDDMPSSARGPHESGGSTSGSSTAELDAPPTSGSAGLTRRELREQAERAEQQEKHAATSEETVSKPRRSWPWTGALQAVAPRGEGRSGPRTAAIPVVTPEPEAHRPGWLQEGTASASASGWRQAWGVRPGSATETAPDAVAPLAPVVDPSVPREARAVLPAAFPAGPVLRPEPAQAPSAPRPVPGAARPVVMPLPDLGTVQGPPPRGGGVRRRPPVQSPTPAEEHEEDR